MGAAMAKEDGIDGEEAIIQGFLASLAAGYPGAYDLKDDCAAITPTPGHDLVVKTDPVAEGVHFFADDAPEHIGWKALAVNVSDLAAKAAVPRAYLMALSFPVAPTRNWMERFARGLGEAQRAFGMHLIGGDTDRRPGPITVSITVFGEVPTGRMIRRGVAKPGDTIYVSGALGSAAVGLRLRAAPDLAVTWGLPLDATAQLMEAYLRPKPRLALREPLRAAASAAMDLSDGLAKDLDRMCRASGCGAVVHLPILPVIDAVRTAMGADKSVRSDVVAGGDDYEVLAAVSSAKAAAFEAAAARCGVPVTAIGRFTAGKGVEFLDGHHAPVSFARKGWDHF